jgi:hypothetical protein
MWRTPAKAGPRSEFEALLRVSEESTGSNLEKAGCAVFFMCEDDVVLFEALEHPVLREAYTRAPPGSKEALAGWLATGDDRAAIAAHMGITRGNLRQHLHCFFKLARELHANA